MNIFEREIAKYERRLGKMEQSSSPNMLASNRLLYQAMLEDNRELLKGWREGQPFVVIGANPTLMRSLGDFQPLNLVRIADRLATGHAETCSDQVRSMGLPDYACDRTILFLPLAVRGEELPRPEIITVRTGACEVVNDTHRTLGRLLDIPVYSIDVPFEDPHEDHLPYVVKQLEGLIDFVEANLPNARYDESKLKEWQALARRWYSALHDVYELRKRVPCPDHPRDVFREPLYPGEFSNPSLVVQYYESYRDELKERAEKGWAAVGEEKLRIVWGVSGPYGSNIWDYLVERGVSVPYWHFGQGLRDYHKPIYGDTTEFGRKLSPLEEEGRWMLYNSWAGSGERWVKDSVFVCRDFKADGMVLFDQTGCQPVLGLSQLTKQRIEEELDIPVWKVEGRMLLGRSERTEAEFMAGLEAFINLCFERKKS